MYWWEARITEKTSYPLVFPDSCKTHELLTRLCSKLQLVDWWGSIIAYLRVPGLFQNERSLAMSSSKNGALSLQIGLVILSDDRIQHFASLSVCTSIDVRRWTRIMPGYIGLDANWFQLVPKILGQPHPSSTTPWPTHPAHTGKYSQSWWSYSALAGIQCFEVYIWFGWFNGNRFIIVHLVLQEISSMLACSPSLSWWLILRRSRETSSNCVPRYILIDQNQLFTNREFETLRVSY